MFCVYALKNPTGKIYIGQTKNIEQRLKRHNDELPNKKSSFSNRNKGPWKVIYKEFYNDRKDAIKREKELKSYQGREFIKNIHL